MSLKVPPAGRGVADGGESIPKLHFGFKKTVALFLAEGAEQIRLVTGRNAVLR